MVNLYYLLISVLPLENHWFWRFELFGSFTVMKLLGLFCLLAAMFSAAQSGFNTRVFRSWPIRWYLTYLAIQFVSYFLHGDGVRVDPSTYFNVLSIASLAIATFAIVTSPVRLHRTILLGIGGAAFASLYTIRGQQGAPSAGFRPSGIFEDANYYALVVGLWIPIAYLWSVGEGSKAERIFCRICLAAMLLGTTFAASRGGFVGLMVSLLFMIWQSRKRLRNFAIAAVAVIPLLVFSPSSPVQRFLHPSNGDVGAQQARLDAWTAGLRMIRAHPLTGVGLGNFKVLMPRYADSEVSFTSVAHNTYIETAAELGIPALIVHLAMLVGTFLAFGRVRRRAAAERWIELYRTALGLQAGFLGYIVSAFFVSTWWQKIPWLLVFIAGCLPPIAEAAIKRRRQKERTRTATIEHPVELQENTSYGT